MDHGASITVRVIVINVQLKDSAQTVSIFY